MEPFPTYPIGSHSLTVIVMANSIEIETKGNVIVTDDRIFNHQICFLRSLQAAKDDQIIRGYLSKG